MDPDLRRLNALVRDEGRLRQSLDEHARRRFDLEAAAAMRQRLAALLETTSFIAHDDAFWARLTETAGTLTREDMDRLRKFDPASLGMLLEAVGYRSPPPPPVDELVDETAAALVAVLDGPFPPGAERIRAARSSLVTLTMRVRRQLDLPPSPLSAAADRGAARQLLRGARFLLPIVAGKAFDAALEMLLVPGTGVGMWLAEMLKGVAGEGVTMAVAYLQGAVHVDRPPDAEQPDDLRYMEPGKAMAVHLAAADTILDQVVAEMLSSDPPARDDVLPSLHRALQHVDRMAELAHDHGGTPAMTTVFAEIGAAIRETLLPHNAGRAASDFATCLSRAYHGIKDAGRSGVGFDALDVFGVARTKHSDKSGTFAEAVPQSSGDAAAEDTAPSTVIGVPAAHTKRDTGKQTMERQTPDMPI